MLVGTPSDEASEILAQGRSGITTLFLSMSERHPDGADAQYLRWHGLDHRPEQHRLRSVRASLRVVSTPACRAARAARVDEFDAVDHVMTYFFTERSGFTGFVNLANALAGADRVPFVLNPVKRGAYVVEDRMAAPRAKAGADVLPWRPAAGVYLLLEEGVASAESLTEVPGVAGLWVAKSLPTEISTVTAGQQLTYCFLDDDPVATAARLRPVLEQRWSAAGVRPLLAAPFYTVVPYEWDRYLP
jgi:hypothetical protein